MSMKIIESNEINNIKILSSLIKNKKQESKFSTKMSKYNPASNNIIIDNENDEFFDEIESEDSTYNENREKQLKILTEKYTKLYHSKEKLFSNIIKEIDIENHLFYKGSINAFNLMILKVKCLLKLLKEKFEHVLNSKDQRNFYEIDLYLPKLKNEFRKLIYIISEDSKYEYEIITQVYCNFLFIMAIISTKKEEHIRSLCYITLGVNMLKVFFVRQNKATDIETYKIYAKLIILLINKLIVDNNISQALIYINLLTKICEIAVNLIYKERLNKKYEYKFNKYNSYGFLFLGYCYELKTNIPNNHKISLKAYKESYYFMSKSKKSSIFGEMKGEVTIEKKAF